MIAELRRRADLGTINNDFLRLTHPPAGADIEEVAAFIRERGWCAAYLVARDNRRLAHLGDEIEWENAVSEVAHKTVSTLLAQLGAGKLTRAAEPIANFVGYIRRIIDGHARDRNRTKTPKHISDLGPEAGDMFQRVVVYGEDLERVQRDLELRTPARAGYLRRTVVPAITAELLRPDPRAKRSRLPSIPVSDLARPDAEGPDIIEETDAAIGRRRPDPAEELIRSIHREAVIAAVSALPEPDRTRARAYFLEHSVSGPAEFARAFGVRNGQYEIKKLEKRLVTALAYLAE